MPRAHSNAREGLNRLLGRYPAAEAVQIENQHKDARIARYEANPWAHADALPDPEGPWTCVDLLDDGELMRFAIWNYTGNCYHLDEQGAVEEDPFIVVTPLHKTRLRCQR